MPTHVEERRDAVKKLADIKAAIPTFDTDIEGFVQQAVDDLWPQAQDELAPVEVAVNEGDREIVLSSGEGIAAMEIDDDPIDPYDWKLHAGTIYFSDPFSESGTLRIFPLGRYEIGADADAADETTVPAELVPVIDYWALAKFYMMLAGNARKYGIYVGAVGSAKSRDMKDSAAYFKQEGNDHLSERTAPEGM